MKKLTQLQYQVIFLYSKGLTFKEIDETLATAEAKSKLHKQQIHKVTAKAQEMLKYLSK